MADIDLTEKYRNFYDGRVISAIENFNKNRKKFRNLIIIQSVMVLAISCLFLALFCFFLSSLFPCLDTVAGILGIFAFVSLSFSTLALHYFYPKTRDLSNLDPEAEIKSELMPDFMKMFGDLTWNKKRDTLILDYNKLQQTMIIPKNITVVGDDYISGKYKDVNIKITEMSVGEMSLFVYIVLFFVCSVLLYVVVSHFIFPLAALIIMAAGYFIHPYASFVLLAVAVGFALYWLVKLLCKLFVYFLTVGHFRGAMIELDMPKKFSGHTFLFENTYSSGAIKRKKKIGYERVTLEDSEFNKIWNIYSDNQQEARYVLTPAFMERLKNISLAFNAEYLRMSFKNNKMTLLAASAKDLFAMGNVFKDTDKKTFDTLFNEIYSVLQLIDDLKLKKEYRK